MTSNNYEFEGYQKNKYLISELVNNDINSLEFFDMMNDYLKKKHFSNLISVHYCDNKEFNTPSGFDHIIKKIDYEVRSHNKYRPISIIVTTILVVLKDHLNNENINKKLFSLECHSVFLICDKHNNNIYFYDPNGEVPDKSWYFIDNKIYKGCQEIKKLITFYSKTYTNVIVPNKPGIQAIPKGYIKDNIIKLINDYRPNTKYIDCGWCMFYNLFAIEYIIDNLKENTLDDIYYNLTTVKGGMYNIFPPYCKESKAINGTAHYSKEPLTIEKYSYQVAKIFSDKV